jgi:glycosyltransferase involved in cell wall biosynthesis
VSGVRPEVAFVVQRYGEGITGGSESLARAVAERLASEYRITVFTSCARDYVTWRNELPAGLEHLGGVDVRRFPVEHERNLEAFNAFAEPLYVRAAAVSDPAGTDTVAGRRSGGRDGPDNGPDNGKNVGAGTARITHADEQEFLRRQGPEVPKLVEALRAERERFSAFVFFTYLYYPTYWGLAAVPERAALVPTTHDEPPLRFSIYREVFARPRAFGFLTPAEEALVRRRFDLGSREAVLAGMGVDVPAPPDVAAFRARYGIARPYAIYAGRIDAGKGCADMLAHHERYRGRQRLRQGQQGDLIDLLLIGRLAMPEPDQDGVRYLGFLPEAEKAAALAGAHAVVCPSPFESLSIALLEGFALGTPGLVNARSEVLKEHCLRSGASLFYEDGDEYAEALDLLAHDASLRGALGASGRRYVETEYRWDVVLDRWRALIRAAAAARL